MSHPWHSVVASTGEISSAESAAALAVRDAVLAAEHETVTVEDATTWNTLISAVNALINTLDPAGTSAVRCRLQAHGAHSGYPDSGIGFSLLLEQPNFESGNRHTWQTKMVRAPSTPEINLAHTLMQADIISMGNAESAEDTVVFDAAIVAVHAFEDLMNPTENAAIVGVDIGASVSVGSLGAVSLSMDVRVVQQQPVSPISVPVGAIMLWSGTLLTIPAGFVLCDGLNGTPDLRDKFVVGAAALANPGATGGALTHAHGAHVNHVVTQPSAHATGNTGTSGGGTRFSNAGAAGHSGAAVDAHSPHDSVDHRPPYYAVAFIMRAS